MERFAHLEGLLEVGAGFFVFALDSGAFAKSFQQISEVQALLGCGVEGESAEVVDGEAVVADGLGVGGEGVGAVSGEFGVMGDAWGVGSAFGEVVDDDGGSLFLATCIGLFEDVGGAAVQAGSAHSGKALVEMADQQGMPEVIGDARAAALFGEHSGLQSFF